MIWVHGQFLTFKNVLLFKQFSYYQVPTVCLMFKVCFNARGFMLNYLFVYKAGPRWPSIAGGAVALLAVLIVALAVVMSR